MSEVIVFPEYGIHRVWSLYTLSDPNGVFYVGISKELKKRYRAHCNNICGLCYNHIYNMRQQGILPKLTILFASNENTIRTAEHALVCYCAAIGQRLFNVSKNPIANQLPIAALLPKSDIKQDRFYINKIIEDANKEYWQRCKEQDEVRPINLDKSTILSQPIKYTSSKCSQLGKKE